jgi:multiple sugar transport system permease protein
MKDLLPTSQSALINKKPWRHRYAHWLLVAPALIYLLLFMGYPLFRGLQLSLTETNTLNPNMSTYLGTKNYQQIFHSSGFFNSFLVTLKYSVGSVLGALLLGMSAALIMNRPVRGRLFFRAMVTLPWAAPPIAVALIFTWMFNPQYGIVNSGLSSLGLVSKETHWLDDPHRALLTLVIITIWMTFPLTSLILLAALQTVPKELFEAARIDGASTRKIFRYVTLPLMRPTIYVMTLLLSIWALRRFDLIWVLTQGGPVDSTSTLVVQLYRESFAFGNLGKGAAIGMVGFVISVLCTVLYLIANNRVEKSQS